MVSQNSIISSGARCALVLGLESTTASSIIRWRVKDKFKETGSNKELLDLTNNDRFVSGTRHLMVLAILVVMAL